MRTKRKLVGLCLLVAILSAASTATAVSNSINYQGRVVVDGTNLNGNAQFKFALVSDGQNLNQQATATATVSLFGGKITAINPVNPGSGYTGIPNVTITNTSGSGAAYTANIAGGQVISFNQISTGSGYSNDPTVTIDPPPTNLVNFTYWSHDGSSSTGAMPITSISLNAVRGLFSVALGDTQYPSMTEPIAPNVFTNDPVLLRIWLDVGNGFDLMSPDQPLGAAHKLLGI